MLQLAFMCMEDGDFETKFGKYERIVLEYGAFVADLKTDKLTRLDAVELPGDLGIHVPIKTDEIVYGEPAMSRSADVVQISGELFELVSGCCHFFELVYFAT